MELKAQRLRILLQPFYYSRSRVKSMYNQTKTRYQRLVKAGIKSNTYSCLLYTSDAADE